MAESAASDDLTLQQAGKAIQSGADAIVNRWIDELRANPDVPVEHRSDLRDHLPMLMRRLGEDLSHRDGEQSPATSEAAEHHGRQRWQLGWHLDEVIRDYQTLRPVLNSFLEQELNTPVTPHLQVKIASLIDEAIIDSIHSYLDFHDAIANDSHRTAAEFAAIISSSTDAIYSTSVDGTIQSWNHAAEKMYGYNADEVVGMKGTMIFPPDRVSEFYELLIVITEGKSIPSTDTVRITKSGKEIAVAVSASPIASRSGEVIGCATIAHDISQRVLDADALRRALEAAEEANRTKSQFLANVSHELRSPMNAIVGMTALALEEDLDPTLRDNIKTVREAASQLSQLVEDLLDVSKLEAGKLELEIGPFSLRKLLEDTMRLAGLRAYQKGIELVCQIELEVPDSLIGDALRLRQIISNLLSNAVKFTDEGEVLLAARLRSQGEGSCELEFEVSDTGIGISDEDSQRIFTPFTQVDSTSTRRYGGSGLGLSIASHLAACLGGTLTVESTVGIGSVFRFSVPFDLYSLSDDENFALLSQDQLRGISALIVDDNDANRSTVKGLLSAWGVNATAVSSAAIALSQLQLAEESGRPYGVLFVDAVMPQTDGFELIANLDRLHVARPATVLMIAPSDRFALRDKCEYVQVDTYLEKPISQSGVFNALVRVFSTVKEQVNDSTAIRDLPPPLRPLRVLVVEDTPANRLVAERVLSRRGHVCVQACNGREALALAQSEELDVILMDVQMPIMDGFQATAAIREWERSVPERIPVPIIAMTAHAMRGDRDRCLAAGMTDYISKPIDIVRLVRMVERFSGWVIKETDDMPILPSSNSEPEQPQKPSKTSPASGIAESIDIEELLKRLRGDRGLLADLVQYYQEDYQQMLENLNSAMESADHHTAHRLAHSLKGLALNFSAARTPQLASDIEQLAGRKELAAAKQLFPELRTAAEQLAKLLVPHGSS